jgi:signal transduction histidine kinase
MDPDRIGQVAGNLLSNAIRYTPAGGSVTVRAGQDSGAFWFQVEDSGIGIPAAEQESVFQPFFRSAGHTRFPQGMGLGLHIAREIVAAHGGSLTLSSRPGEGTTFTVRLPRGVAQKPASG